MGMVPIPPPREDIILPWEPGYISPAPDDDNWQPRQAEDNPFRKEPFGWKHLALVLWIAIIPLSILIGVLTG
jgi:hypothetical protein